MLHCKQCNMQWITMLLPTTKCSTAFSTTAALAVPLAQSSNPVKRMFPTYLLQFHIISWSPAQISHHAWRQLPSCAFLMFSPPPLWSMVMTIVPCNKQEQSLIRTARIIIKSCKWIVSWILRRKKGFILLLSWYEDHTHSPCHDWAELIKSSSLKYKINTCSVVGVHEQPPSSFVGD